MFFQKNKKGETMVKRRRVRRARARFMPTLRRSKRASRRGFFGFSRRKGRRSSGASSDTFSMKGVLKVFVPAATYGAVRERMSDYLFPRLAPYVGNFLGDMTDEVIMGGAAIVVGKYLGKNNEFVRNVAKSALVIESARIGQNLSNRMMGGSTATATVQTRVF